MDHIKSKYTRKNGLKPPYLTKMDHRNTFVNRELFYAFGTFYLMIITSYFMHSALCASCITLVNTQQELLSINPDNHLHDYLVTNQNKGLFSCEHEQAFILICITSVYVIWRIIKAPPRFPRRSKFFIVCS